MAIDLKDLEILHLKRALRVERLKNLTLIVSQANEKIPLIADEIEALDIEIAKHRPDKELQ